jgi:hypothetical protein
MSEEDEAFYEVLRAGPDAGPSSDSYVRFDEIKDVLASMDLLELVTPRLRENPALWKWAIIGAQSALQGAMVCALADTTGTSVLTKKSGAELLTWIQSDSDQRGEPPKERLAEFDTLLDKSISELGLILTEQENKDIRRLHQYFRNRFAHFVPMGWGIEKTGLPRIIGAALFAIEYLMGSQRAAMHIDDEDRRRLKETLVHCRKELNRLADCLL